MEVQTVLLAAIMAGIVATAVTVLIEKYGGVIGGSEPDSEDIVWLPGDVELQIQNLFSSIVSLASAGYPGCIGCIDEEPWSEREWRAVVKN